MSREISTPATAEIRRMAEQEVSLNIGSVCCDPLHRVVEGMERDSELQGSYHIPVSVTRTHKNVTRRYVDVLLKFY